MFWYPTRLNLIANQTISYIYLVTEDQNLVWSKTFFIVACLNSNTAQPHVLELASGRAYVTQKHAIHKLEGQMDGLATAARVERSSTSPS